MARIAPAVEPLLGTAGGIDPAELARRAGRASVLASVERLRHGSPLLESLAREDGLRVVGAEYALETGRVEWLDGVAAAL